MADKPACKHLGDDWFCAHPLMQYLSTQIGDAGCYPDGCPCHEPQPDPTPYTEPPKDANE